MVCRARSAISLYASAGLVVAALAAGWPAPARAARRKKVDPRVSRYQATLRAGQAQAAVERLVAAVASPGSVAELDALAAALAPKGDQAAPVLRALLVTRSPMAPAATADLLWRIALRRRLTDALAALAAQLLDHRDPFVVGLAEWAIATRVGMDNGGARIAWPRPDPPPWFQRWAALPPDALIDADYVRMAVGWHIHYSGAKLHSSVRAILGRARAAAAELLASDPPPATRAMAARQLAAIAAIEATLARRLASAPADITGHRTLWLDARRAARPIVLANPAVDFDRLLFIKRHPAHSHRNITGSQYPWCHKPGGDIYVQRGLEPGGELHPVLDGALGPGHVHGMDLWWDADRVAFAYARQPTWPPKHDPVRGNHVFLLRHDQEPTHIFESPLDPATGRRPRDSRIRQVTRHHHWSDIEPTYCANGDIVFASGRNGRSSECGNFRADHTVVNLYAVSPDGTRLRRLSDNKDIDRYPHSLDNGLIAYTRWEYQERHFIETHAIWTIRPDGTMADAVSNQHQRWPCALRDARSIPGSPKLVAVATGHHTFAYGPLVVVDPRRGINAGHAIRIVTPYVRPQEGGMVGDRVAQGGVPDQGGLYQTPWALSETCFLAAYSHALPPSGTGGGANAHGFALYLLDAHGNKELVHRDLLLSCAFPIPLRRRPRPPLVPAATDHASRFATCCVTDIYDGLDGIPRGAVKHIRILNRPGWPLDEKIGAMRWIHNAAYAHQPGVSAWSPVRVVGTVPVEPDGSAHFKVPVDAAVYFQALDARHMELRRMRSHITFQPGEVRGCRGCHETQAQAPTNAARAPLAAARPPRTPTPPAWGATRLLGYEWLIQPILDRRCTRCHGPDKPDGGVDLSPTRAAGGRFQSFRTLLGYPKGANRRRRSFVALSNRFSNASISRPKEFGSHRSRLTQLLLNDELHVKEAKLTQDEWRALVTWVDANAPYHDRFFNRRPAGGGKARRDILIDFPAPFVAPSRSLGIGITWDYYGSASR